MEGKTSILNGNYRQRKDAIKKCAEAALSFGYEVFGVQHGGQCFSGIDAINSYKKHGQSTNCNSDGKGAWGANQVYQFRKGKKL